MRRYVIPQDNLLREFSNKLHELGITKLWTSETYNGISMLHTPDFMSNGTTEACIKLSEFFEAWIVSRSSDSMPVCIRMEPEYEPYVSCVYENGLFYSSLPDWPAEAMKPAGPELEDNEFLREFRRLLKRYSIDIVWTDFNFIGEKESGVFYYLDAYDFPPQLDDIVDPYVDDPKQYSDVRSYCVPTKHVYDERYRLIYKDGIFYRGDSK